MKLINKVKGRNALGHFQYFDFKMGAAGAFVLGGIVLYINYDYGIPAASVAAVKQATYTFLVGGIIVRICENLATRYNNINIAIFMSILVPSLLAVGLTFGVHSTRGTPEPLNSTIPTIILSPISFAIWGIRKRKQLGMASGNDPHDAPVQNKKPPDLP
ncbi:MAG: hypothetical protein KAG99_07975 [Bacteroidales bacterium]|nr:hypothetical protein [Bacteroidales bacterium]